MAHFETTHTTHDGEELYLQAWVPDDFKAAVLLVHGLAEHSGRYSHVAEAFNQGGYAVYSFDGRGHGKSAKGAPDAFYASIDEYTKDVDALFGKVKEHAAGKPCFIYGHSMGGLLATYYEMTHHPELAGIILSGPLLTVADDVSPLLIGISKIMSRIAPKLATTKLDGADISRDPKEVEKYDNDPLNYRGGIRARVGAEMLKGIQHVESNLAEFKNPFLVMHGTADKLTDPKGSQALYENASSADKTIKLWDGLFHEIHNEPEKEEVIAEALAWMDARVS